MNKGIIIAIDGPVAAGKGTLAPTLAKTLSGVYLYTGALYRCLALVAMEMGISLTDENALVEVAKSLSLEFKGDRIIVNGADMTEKIKTPEVAAASARVSTFALIREESNIKQRQIADVSLQKGITVVAEGRDAGTKIFPDAEVKIFLTASVEERARRRMQQFIDQGLSNISLETVIEEIQNRDHQDQTRKESPLVITPEEHGYVIIDGTGETEEQTIKQILQVLQEKKAI